MTASSRPSHPTSNQQQSLLLLLNIHKVQVVATDTAVHVPECVKICFNFYSDKIYEKFSGEGNSPLTRSIPNGEGDTSSPHPSPLGACGLRHLDSSHSKILGTPLQVLLPLIQGTNDAKFFGWAKSLPPSPLVFPLSSLSFASAMLDPSMIYHFFLNILNSHYVHTDGRHF